MLKLAVIGAQTLLGRELVQVLEAKECSVLPLSTGPLKQDEEEGDIVVFAPDPSLLEGLDLLVLADAPQDTVLLEAFSGRILDLRPEPDKIGEPLPLSGTWPRGVKRLYNRPAVEQVLMVLPALVDGIAELEGTHLRSVAFLGDRGTEGLHAQTKAVLKGMEPDTGSLGYRAAFEVIPQIPRGNLVEVWVPVFHGDLLFLHLRAQEGEKLAKKEASEGMKWVELPPSSRDVAVSIELLAHFSPSGDGMRGVLSIGFDPILWGVMRPTLRVLDL
jgi:hypothetical protein